MKILRHGGNKMYKSYLWIKCRKFLSDQQLSGEWKDIGLDKIADNLTRFVENEIEDIFTKKHKKNEKK